MITGGGTRPSPGRLSKKFDPGEVVAIMTIRDTEEVIL
jgi:hypothetical protein